MAGSIYSQRMLNLLIATLNVAIHLFSCLLVAYFLSGLLHWFEDTWLASGKNALLDRIIVEPNIDHHRRPGGIREGTYWINNFVCKSMTAAGAGVRAACGVHAWEPYVVLLIAPQSNQIHAWGHSASPPAIIALLQCIHVLQSAKEHAALMRLSHYAFTTLALQTGDRWR